VNRTPKTDYLPTSIELSSRVIFVGHVSDSFLLVAFFFFPFVELVATIPEIGNSPKRGLLCAKSSDGKWGRTLAEGLSLIVREGGAPCVEVGGSFPNRLLITRSIEQERHPLPKGLPPDYVLHTVRVPAKSVVSLQAQTAEARALSCYLALMAPSSSLVVSVEPCEDGSLGLAGGWMLSDRGMCSVSCDVSLASSVGSHRFAWFALAPMLTCPSVWFHPCLS
jgi:hypothetical protein